MGRRKIKMEMVQDMNTRQVTFSKRRTGLFKKASELATLCNAEIGIVVFSPGGKPYSYGKPNLDAVTERFKKEDHDSDSESEEEEKEEGRCKSRPKMKKVNERLDCLNREIEAEKKRGEKSQAKLESAGEKRFKKPIEKLTIDELKEYMEKLEGIHCRIIGQVNEMQASSCLVLISENKAPNRMKI
ncbi:unnamed protein product [Eruca vesicaria subsp. sativa]|uniref:MADS-box domain-containing protein n=1 Tax=Eruca vesicaria subsp. sativa TaxID=29727 RepID=A0ABC8KZQ7_ERUVS|nr:unnamed protein product [Eruca vesicaria subsp. sativa]